MDGRAAEGEVGVGPEENGAGRLGEVEVAVLQERAKREAGAGGSAEEDRGGRVGAAFEDGAVGADGVVEGGGIGMGRREAVVDAVGVAVRPERVLGGRAGFERRAAAHEPAAVEVQHRSRRVAGR